MKDAFDQPPMYLYANVSDQEAVNLRFKQLLLISFCVHLTHKNKVNNRFLVHVIIE